MYKLTLCIALACCIQQVAMAQDSIKKTMDTVVVTAFRFPLEKIKQPFTTKQIRNKDWQMQAPNMAEILQNTGFVNVQKSQAGGGSPIIRGFEASRILLMVDGVRMNNAIYRSGHLQNIITVDPNSLETVDVLFGPGSTQFGSDALGGVVHMQTKKPILSNNAKPLVKGNMNSRYSSAFNELQQHIDINIGGSKLASITSFTYSNFGDLVQGGKRSADYPNFGKRSFYVNTISGNDYMIANNNYNKQIGTAYNQVDFMQKLLFKPKANKEHILNFQLSQSTDIPRYDRLTELAGSLPRFAEWYYGPQKRLMASHQYSQDFANAVVKKLNSILSYQSIEESRYDRRFNNQNRNSRIEDVRIMSYTLDALVNTKSGSLHTGIDMQWNKVMSEAYSQHIVTNAKSYNIANRYPDGKNNMSTLAAYLQQIYNLSTGTTFNYGLRATTTSLAANIKNNAVMNFPFTKINQQNSAIVGNIGLTHRTANSWKLAAVVSNGFRTPNFDELKVFDSRAGFLIVPNENIKPEYSYNAEINVSKYAGALQTEVALYYTLLRNAIQIGNATLNGSSTINYLGTAAQVQMALNSGKGFLYGASANIIYTIAKKTTVEASYNYSYGRIDSAGTLQPLDHIPPVYGRLSVTHTETKWLVQAYGLFNGAKKLNQYSSSGEDNLQYATATGMPNWFTINLKTQHQLHSKIKLQFGIENILDKNYRVFGSGVSAAGRNFIIGLNAGF